ncbi:MAG: PKD domain-containing protein [Bacteroidetes bacterium]|nr:PKD domain-containing protein [Bacteroidota bacterium]MBU1718688.1 PKD domain-containing protein [Bacteroidota bacterium]
MVRKIYSFIIVNVVLAACATTVNAQCFASFNAYTPLQSTIITNQSTGTYNAVFWDFGDGKFSNNNNVTQHQYANPGYYTICLTIADTTTGCIDDTCLTIEVGNISNSCNTNFSYVGTGTTISFTDLTTNGPGSWLWNFGDGVTSTDQNPTHVFVADGIYSVTLTTRGTTFACMDSYTDWVIVGNAANDCEADFAYFSRLIDRKVRFQNFSAGSNLTDFVWNFGDGDTSRFENPIHAYHQPGYYDVCLSVYNANGSCSNITCKTIKVGDDPASCKARFIYYVDTLSGSVEFSDVSFGSPQTWEWDFGDLSITSALENPIHTFNTNDFFLVHQTMINTGGCIDNEYQLINLGVGIAGLKADFAFIPDTTSKSNQYPVDFKGAAFGDPAVIMWDFGDGSMDSTTMDPTHVYENAGFYDVCFTVSDPITGDADTDCQNLLVGDTTVSAAFYELNARFLVYPNPAANVLNISYVSPAGGQTIVTLSDFRGRKLQEQHFSGTSWNAEMNTSELQNGIYLLSIEGKAGRFTRKVCISGK